MAQPHESNTLQSQDPGESGKSTTPAPATVSKPVRRYRARLFQIYAILAAVAFGVLFVLARSIPYFAFDLPISLAVQSLQSNALDAVMVFISSFGYSPVSYLICGLVLVFLILRGLRWEALTTLLALAIVPIGLAIKLAVARPRPTSDLVRVLSSISESSFPSGHVLMYTGLFGIVLFLLYTLAPRAWWRTLGIVVAGALIALIGVSRIYLGMHWFSDVLGAYLLASLWLILVIYVYRWGKRKKLLARK